MVTFNYVPIPVDSSKNEIRVVEMVLSSLDLESTLPDTSQFVQATDFLRPRVRCNLKGVSLDDAPVYTALSYTWGDRDKTGLIILNDTEVSVGANLESALYHLRDAITIVTLWADALCINQTDQGEKSELVSRMRRIYQDANQVIVWLGPSEEESDSALQAMEQIGKEACDFGFWDVPRQDFQKAYLDAHTPYSKLFGLLNEKISLDLPLEAVCKITLRAYWYRVWVLQEFVLASNVGLACGFSIIEFPHFAAAITFFAVGVVKLLNGFQLEDWEDPIKRPKQEKIFKRNQNPRATTMVGARRKFHDDFGSRESLIQLLRKASCVSTDGKRLQATEPSDRIFGLLGLATDTDQLGIRPDHSMSCQAVYIDAARQLLYHGHTDILLFSQFPKDHSDLPTWVPDWTATIQEPCGGCLADETFSASGQMSFSRAPGSSANLEDLVALTGVRVDTINQVRSPWLPGLKAEAADYVQAKHFVSDIESHCEQSDQLNRPIYKSREQRGEAAWRIPCGDMERLSNGWRTRARGVSPDVFEGFKLFKGSDQVSKTFTEPQPQHGSYVTSMCDMFKRRPFLSTQGYVGLAPSHAEVGDVIVIIHGAAVPFVLRNVENGRFNLVGEAYVHGIMDGEFVENNPPTETFRVDPGVKPDPP